ncbi:hypothetical protein T296_05125 [Pantoea agglomerans Eh318]|nr:hypothetical protein T296_05125 [Pantoea agglomerans Eh318]
MNLSKATFRHSKITRVDFSDCNLLETNFEHATIFNSFFNNAKICRSHLQDAEFMLTRFDNSDLNGANLKNAQFNDSQFYEAQFYRANLEGTKFMGGGMNPFAGGELRMNLCGAIFHNARFDNETYFDKFFVSRETDFRTTSFEAANYSAGLRQTLQYCNRKHNWEDWYRKQGKLLTFFVKTFWGYSDYGSSIKQIIKSFFAISFFFR